MTWASLYWSPTYTKRLFYGELKQRLRDDGEGKRKNEFWVTSLVSRSGFDPGLRSSFYLMETLCVSKSVLKMAVTIYEREIPTAKKCTKQRGYRAKLLIWILKLYCSFAVAVAVAVNVIVITS